MNKIIIYTDGGCRGNPGIGGWGAWLRYGDHDKKLKGSEKDTTNNRMELTAAIKALEAIKSSTIDIDLYTDSKYVMSGINEWIKSWKLRGWKTANKKPVKNVDLWQKLMRSIPSTMYTGIGLRAIVAMKAMIWQMN